MIEENTFKNRNLLYCSMVEAMEEISFSHSRPSSIGYFEDKLESFYEPDAEITLEVIGSYCMMIPEELIYAAGAVSIRLCAESHEAILIGEEVLPRTSCSMVKSIAGIAHGNMSKIFDSCKAVIIPTTCDWKKKLGETLSNYANVWTMEVPHIKDSESSRKHWYEEVVTLKQKLEEITGNKITKKKLIAAVKTVHKAQLEFRRLNKLRMNIPPVISGRDAMLATQGYFYDTPVSWTENIKKLNEELDKKISQREYICSEETPRMLITGSPIMFPNWKLPNLIESYGGIIVTDEFCTSSRYLYDMVAIDELSMSELLGAIADRYLLPCTCPCFTNNNDRINKVMRMVQDFNVDGVIYHTLSGCHLYDIESYNFEKAFRKKSIPFLKVTTDHTSEDEGQLRTRVEAFIESISGY